MKFSLGRAMTLAALPVLLLAAGAGTALAQPASGSPPPPAGFEADSASFVSAQNGFVLGSRDCGRLPCWAMIEGTTNGAKTWAKVHAPAIKLDAPGVGPSPATSVSTIRFENSSDGWLFNPGLWQTTDGGAHWTRIKLPGNVVDVAASDGTAFAIAVPVDAGYYQAKLYESTAGGAWTLVKGVWPALDLTVSGSSVWVGVAPDMSTSTNSGASWTKLSFRCPADYPAASAIAAASPADVAIACSNQGDPQPGFSYKEVFTSSNGGRSFHVEGNPPIQGQVIQLAMPTGNPKIITMTAASGASYFFRSTNGGETWSKTVYFDGGLYFRDLEYVSGTTGYVIHFSGGPVLAYSDGLMKTVNEGKNWTAVSIP
jgi:photosystem II stability/assembly factor-like uncharacterized protein